MMAFRNIMLVEMWLGCEWHRCTIGERNWRFAERLIMVG